VFSDVCPVTPSLSRSLSASSSMSSHGKMLPILVSVHSFFSCRSLSPPMNSRSRFASPWVVMAPTRYFQQGCVLLLRSSSVLYSQHFECEPLSPQERLSRPSLSFSHACRVRIPDSYEHRSCVATSHMETSTRSLAWFVASWPHAPRLNATMSLETLCFRLP
jgi:hypothetical protein